MLLIYKEVNGVLHLQALIYEEKDQRAGSYVAYKALKGTNNSELPYANGDHRACQTGSSYTNKRKKMKKKKKKKKKKTLKSSVFKLLYMKRKSIEREAGEGLQSSERNQQQRATERTQLTYHEVK